MRLMHYKGYVPKIEHNGEDGRIVGRIAGTPDAVGFRAANASELKDAFEEAVDAYIEIRRKPEPAAGIRTPNEPLFSRSLKTPGDWRFQRPARRCRPGKPWVPGYNH